MTIKERAISILAATIAAASATLAVAQSVAPKAPPAICIGSNCVSAIATNAQGIKWHPGHYGWYMPPAIDAVSGYRFDIKGHQDKILTFLDSIASEPTVKGVLLAVQWKALEGDTAGNYAAGFAAMDAILAKAAAVNKKVLIRLEARVDGGYAALTDVFPAYVTTGSNYGTSVVNHIGGSYSGVTARLWQTATADRLIQLIRAYGTRYNSHPAMEMFGLGETAIYLPDGQDGFSNQAWLTQLQRMLAAAREAWPNTALRISANDLYPDSLMRQLLATCDQYSVAVGGPDVWPLDVTQADRVFAGLDLAGQRTYTDYRDRLPWAVEAQWQSYDGRFTMQQLWDSQYSGYTAPNTRYDGGPNAGQNFVMPSMKVKYFIWYVNESNGNASTQWRTAELPLIRSLNGVTYPQPCPTSYRSGCMAD